MPQGYSNPERETDPHALPDIETFELTAHEVAERDEDMMWEYMKRREYRLASMNSKVREKMLDAMVQENGIEGGWFYWYCFPGCLPDSQAIGPFKSCKEALNAAQEEAAEGL